VLKVHLNQETMLFTLKWIGIRIMIDIWPYPSMVKMEFNSVKCLLTTNKKDTYWKDY